MLRDAVRPMSQPQLWHRHRHTDPEPEECRPETPIRRDQTKNALVGAGRTGTNRSWCTEATTGTRDESAGALCSNWSSTQDTATALRAKRTALMAFVKTGFVSLDPLG